MLRVIVAVLLCAFVRRTCAGCAPSEKPLSEDLTRRQCLRGCEITDGSLRKTVADTVVEPRFEEWEAFCYETSLFDSWDKDCENFYCCLYGCAVFGGDRSVCHGAAIEQRPSLMERANLANNEKSKRCDIQKCRAWCSRDVFDTCKEMQYKESCKYDTAGLFRCDVECGGALRRTSFSVGLLLSLVFLRGGGL